MEKKKRERERDNMVVNDENYSLHSPGNVIEPWNLAHLLMYVTIVVQCYGMKKEVQNLEGLEFQNFLCAVWRVR